MTCRDTRNAKKQAASRARAPRRPEYPTEYVRRPLPTGAKRRAQRQVTRLRPSLVPGTVVILLAGRFRGCRVVFLKQLPKSGLLMVSGPLALNGVPLRRVNQAYVIATSTRVDVSEVDVTAIDDAWFTAGAAKQRAARRRQQKKRQAEAGEMDVDKPSEGRPPEKIALQKQVDNALLASIKKEPLLKEYLQSRFSLTKGQYPHQMKF